VLQQRRGIRIPHLGYGEKDVFVRYFDVVGERCKASRRAGRSTDGRHAAGEQVNAEAIEVDGASPCVTSSFW